MRLYEIQQSKLVIFDIDDTLVHTQTKVHVVKDDRKQLYQNHAWLKARGHEQQ